MSISFMVTCFLHIKMLIAVKTLSENSFDAQDLIDNMYKNAK